MENIGENEVLEKLKSIKDPEMGINIVDLGLVYKVHSHEGGKVTVDMTLTGKGCPISDVIKYEIEEALKDIPGVREAAVNFVWEPEWNYSMISPAGLEILELKPHKHK